MERPTPSWQMESLGTRRLHDSCGRSGGPICSAQYDGGTRTRRGRTATREDTMPGKRLLLALTGAMAAALATGAAAQDDAIKIGFLPGVVDPFYQVMELGVNKAAEDLGDRGGDADPADLGCRGADADPRRAGCARRPRLHHHRAGREGPDGRAAAGGARRRDQGDHRRHLPRRRRLRRRARHLPAQLHRLGQRRRRPDLGARPGRGDRRQGQGLHQFDEPERQLGRGPRAEASPR